MTTNHVRNEEISRKSLENLEENLAKVEELTGRLMAAFSKGRAIPQGLSGPTPELYAKAATAYWAEIMNNPAKLMEHQLEYWAKSVRHFVEAQNALMHRTEEVEEDGPKDQRFQHELWSTNPYFRLIKQQYLTNAQTIRDRVSDLDGLAEDERRRLSYFSEQIVDMLSPTNFLPTNPEALSLAAETEGQSLVQGLENLVRDLEANDGDLVVSLADKEAFVLGQNLATTEGSVVYRNELFELIQYAPKTKTVFETPLLIFPPWINKFYILDLRPDNSLIKWIVEQGYTLFVASWVNPDPSMRELSMTDYVERGYLAAFEQVKKICNVPSVNAVGYCIAGTTLSLTLSLLKQRGDTSVNAATLFTTLTDFSDRGEVGVFLEDDFVDSIEAEVEAHGILDRFYMARTFSFLRSNDLIYRPAIKSYMMGQSPPAFDLLYWNGDGTNLPACMSVEYLRGLCQNDKFANGEGFEIAGTTVHLIDVEVPLCAIACETDHIAAWKSSYRGVQKMGSSDKTFILAGSGHIAGIVNPPQKNKYGHWTNPELGLSPQDWQDSAEKHEGSWWGLWNDWLSKRSGKQIAARQPGSKDYPVLGPAPGTYVIAGH